MYYFRWRDAIAARMEVENGDSQLQCLFFDKPCTSHFLMHSGSHRTSTINFEVWQRTVA